MLRMTSNGRGWERLFPEALELIYCTRDLSWGDATHFYSPQKGNLRDGRNCCTMDQCGEPVGFYQVTLQPGASMAQKGNPFSTKPKATQEMAEESCGPGGFPQVLSTA